jgi:hypothetical protein
MGKRNQSALESTETMVSEDQSNDLPLTHESAGVVESKPALTEESPEIIALRAKLADLESEQKALLEALKTKKTEVKDLTKEIGALLKGETVKIKSQHKTVFVGTDIPIKDLKTKKDKPLSYQGRLLLEMFIGGVEVGVEKEYTRDEILAKLEDYPCVGDKMDNFAWYKSQVFKPMGLVK